MSNERMFRLDQITAIEQGGLRALCLPRVRPGSAGQGVVANHWLVRGLVLPPRAPIQFVRSPVQPTVSSPDAWTVLQDAWQRLGLPAQGVDFWAEEEQTYTSMPSHDPAAYAVPVTPANPLLGATARGKLREMDGGEVYAFNPGNSPEPTAYGFRATEPPPRAPSAGPLATWIEYWGLLANYNPADQHVCQVVEAIPGPKPYTNLVEFLHFMQPKVNEEGARLVIASVASYGAFPSSAAGSDRGQGASPSIAGHAETH